MKTFTQIVTPLGTFLAIAEDGALVRISFPGAAPEPSWVRDDAGLASVRAQLGAYFAGDLVDFDIPLAPGGTAFENRVWRALRKIPYGQTVSYSELARAIGAPNGARAVGQANGRNPIPIVVPCHRVVAAGGKLGGYAGGLEIKRTLLQLERRPAAALALT
jgi:methylated-DNA-[protein]-cysteine S-methyltransferase